MLFEILGPFIDLITSIIGGLGYVGVFGLMVLESALIPIPSEIIMPFSGFLVFQGKMDFVGAIAAGSLGNLAGSVAIYFLGKRAGRAFAAKYGKYVLFNEHHLQVTERIFQKHGGKIAFVGRLLPAIRTYVSLPAGIGKISFGKFVVFTLAGSVIWNVFLVYAGVQLGSNWKNIEKYSPYLDAAAAVALALFIVWYIKSKKQVESERPGSKSQSNLG